MGASPRALCHSNIPLCGRDGAFRSPCVVFFVSGVRAVCLRTEVGARIRVLALHMLEVIGSDCSEFYAISSKNGAFSEMKDLHQNSAPLVCFGPYLHALASAPYLS